MAVKVDIKVVSGLSAGDVFHFIVEQAKPVLIGRDQNCTIVLEDPRVSRCHVSIELDEYNKLSIVDQGSTHGTLHMGFPLSPGLGGRRSLANNDEFKVGDTIFAVAFVEEKAQQSSPATDHRSLLRKKPTKKKLVICLLLILVFLMLCTLLVTGDKGKKSSAGDQSEKFFTLPAERVLGYWLTGAEPQMRDTKHADKVQFVLPASDLLVEYDYSGETEVRVLIDGSAVDNLVPHKDTWQRRQLVIRDIMVGQERHLVFDNLDYPKPSAVPEDRQKAIKMWAVRNARVTSIARDPFKGLDALLAEAAVQANAVESTPQALFYLIRALQSCILSALVELQLDAIGFESISSKNEVTMEGEDKPILELDSNKLTKRIEEIRDQRNKDLQLLSERGYLLLLSNLVGELDADLWRRVNSRLVAAEFSARTKNHIGAYDNLIAVRMMFPGEDDYRWLLAERMLQDSKIVPKRVRLRPGRYRKK